MKNALVYLLISLMILPLAPLGAWEPYDRIIAVVNSDPIVQSEVELRLEFLRKQKKINKRNINIERSKILDKFIEDALIRQTSQEISVIISDKKVLGHMEKMMQRYFLGKIKD